jgi:hypothetical protein
MFTFAINFEIYAALHRRVFEFVSRALFKEDRLMFALAYIRATSPSASGSADRAEWDLFLLGQQVCSSLLFIFKSIKNFGKHLLINF